MLKYGFSGRWLTAGADAPAGESQIGEDFFGLCVASSKDPTCDDFVIERLKELGLRQVRLDFTSGSRTTFQERFLRRLIDEKFRVCLHLVQSRSEAEGMQKSAQAREDWRLFVAEILTTYGREVDLIEIGSTCNRRKWSGYTLPGYLKAWRIACEVASAHNYTLAAPNVTDFEPVYNIALLSEMKRNNLLPAVHTNNLFVERTTEPEAYDHKIAGRMFANMLRFNLVRKACLLNDIALSFGVRRTICSHVSWSLRRIARFLGATDEKQADYLTRYCCLAAASGALKRVYWGPLIGQREGLIDDGTSEFPEIPHVTFYGRTRGNISDYKIRPAYYAFQAVNRFLAGSRYIRKIPSEHGLEIHEFHKADGLLHIAWTMNGRCALTKDCYPAAILEQAHCYSRDGMSLARPPAMISESPIYIMWPGQTDFVASGEVMATDSLAELPGRSEPGSGTGGQAVARHGVARSPHMQPSQPEALLRRSRPVRRYNKALLEHMFAGPGELRTLKNIRFVNIAGRQYDFMTHNDLSGVCRPGAADLILNMFTLLKAGGQAGQDVLRDARNRVWRIMFGEDKDAAVVIKQFRPLSPVKRFFARHKGDKALRSWNGANELLRRGVSTPRPIAFFHCVKNPLAGESWYVCEDFAGSFSVRNAFTAFSEAPRALAKPSDLSADLSGVALAKTEAIRAKGEAREVLNKPQVLPAKEGNGAGEFEGVKAGEFYGQIALFLREIHDRGVYFRDLSAGNLLFRFRSDKSIEFALIDTARALFYDKSISLRQRLCDLMRICHPLCWKGRKIFLAKYMAFTGRHYRAWMNIAFHYYDLKHLVKGKFRKAMCW